jgi:protein SCO1
VKISSYVMSALLMVMAAPALAAIAPPPPQDLIHFDQNLGASIPLSTRFADEHGRVDTLEHFLDARPAVLFMGYNHCPNLCSAVRSSLAHALDSTDLSPGTDYRVLSVSIDANESSAMPVLAGGATDVSATEHAQRGWHFLRGDAPSIAALAASVGFHYRYDEDTDQYAHPAGVVILTPQGTISRYFLGVDFPPQDIESSLLGARRDRIGSPVRDLLLRCFHYDPTIGKYSLTVEYVVRVVAALTCASLLVLFLALRRGSPAARPAGADRP